MKKLPCWELVKIIKTQTKQVHALKKNLSHFLGEKLIPSSKCQKF